MDLRNAMAEKADPIHSEAAAFRQAKAGRPDELGIQEQWERKENGASEKEIAEARVLIGTSYEEIKGLLTKYLDIPESHKTVIALWILGTYIHGNFETYPYLFFNAMRGSGKTRVLKLITSLAADGQLLASLTEAALFRTTGTLGIDEFESIASKEKQALRELLNTAYKKGIKVLRMKKKKVLGQEEQVAEEYETYRPIVMANINGIEEVLQDRSIQMILEKSQNPAIVKLLENFDTNPKILAIKLRLCEPKCRLCLCRVAKNIYTGWEEYVLDKYSNPSYPSLHTQHTQHTQPTLTDTKPEDIEKLEIFNKIDETGIFGRQLELYFPLFSIALGLNESIFDELLGIAKSSVLSKRDEEYSDSKDVLVYRLVSVKPEGDFIKIKELTQELRFMIDEGDMKWLDAEWMGYALKRLNLIIDKRRHADGRQVTLNVKKAIEKLKLFETTK